MLARVRTATVLGVEAFDVIVEAHVTVGLQVFHISGLPDGAVKESRHRIPAALSSAGFRFPLDKLTINLAPADMRKDGAGLDVPIALGILLATGLDQRTPLRLPLDEMIVLGELGLDGSIKPVRGVLPAAVRAKKLGLRGMILPAANAPEAAIVEGLEIYAVDDLRQLYDWLTGKLTLDPVLAQACADAPTARSTLDFSEVAGQGPVKRALEVAAAGGHNILMLGPPGSGKSMLSKRLPTILPPMTFEEALETTSIYSVTGLIPERSGLMRARPFRHPHHTISDVGLAGGGSGMPRPGEVSLAHHGVLFLDELPEFRKHALEVLRQPLEDGHVTVSRSLTTLVFPANIMLVAAMNPCKCGYFGSEHVRRCTCSREQIAKYRAKISGPLMDRIDLHIEVPAISYQELKRCGQGERSSVIRDRVERARIIQRERLSGHGLYTNAQLRPAQLREHCALDVQGHKLLERVVDRLGMSARACDRILKVARTIADLAQAKQVSADHVAEAIQYRALDRPVQQAA